MTAETLTPLARASLRSQVYERLLQAIIAGEIEPSARLRDQDLATPLGVSRTPVREPLQRLEDEGLVETRRGSLTRVMPLDTSAARDTFPVVAALHALAIRMSTPQMSATDVDALRTANRDLESALGSHEVMRAIAADDSFHRRFVERSGNTEVGPTLDRLTSKIRRLEVAQFGSRASLRSVEQHEAIIAAVVGHDATRAAECVEEDWLSLGALTLATFHPPNG